MLSIIEKVIFLQGVDIFEHVPAEGLSQIANITDEMGVEANGVIYKEGEISDSMYLLIDGKVKLHRGESIVLIASLNDAFGTWSLFNDEPRLVSATAIEKSDLLIIQKEDMIDILADNVRITEGILKAMAKRLQSIVRKVTGKPENSH